MEKGYLALVLHAHLPFVRHPESEWYLEERWLFEAITESYIPLLQVFEGLVNDGVDFRVTLSITPTLIAMLKDALLQQRYLSYLHKLLELASKEMERTQGDADFHPLACEYRRRLEGVHAFYQACHHDLLAVFRSLQDMGYLEIMTSAATHAFLPLMETPEAMRAQIMTGMDVYRQTFGRNPRGIWLPECGFAPGVDSILRECGLEYFIADTHALTTAQPAPVFGTLSPVLTPAGVAAFARDESSSKQVWSSKEGYPGDGDYREYYRDIGFDLDLETIAPYIHPAGIRVNTGIKYFRITGEGMEKQPYNFLRAREKAAIHAGNFWFNRQKQVEHWNYHMGRKPIVVAPYDAELFGHWWYEGPVWIDMLLRKIHFDQDSLKTITPSEYLRRYSDFQVCDLTMSSWGRRGYADVWLRGENDWIYPALHLGEQRMIQLAHRFPTPTPLERRALNQAARELMLAQSSDWAFIMDNRTMVDYAVNRVKQHVARFTKLYDMLMQGAVDAAWLEQVETFHPIFPEIRYEYYQTPNAANHLPTPSTRPKVLVLSWEFPPMTVGGLARHVYDLTRHLVHLGWEVHVVTTEIGEYPAYEQVEGVHVHRVHVLQPDGGEFIHWVFQLNLAMVEACQRLVASGLQFDLMHAHDWLVCHTAKALKALYRWPLVATIHATEHGRNQGIHTDVQRYIHHLEWTLTYEAARVIVCSAAMQREVEQVFRLPGDKIHVLPNGVDPRMLRPPSVRAASAAEHPRTILYVGRLVREKGVHLLIQAAPLIVSAYPDVQFRIAGQGPMMDELKQLAQQLQVQDHVQFLGYVSDEVRNDLLAKAYAAVFPSLYEPFGIVALEAMAAGTPVVVSDVGGLGDVVDHGRTGLTVLPGNPQSIADQVMQLLRNPAWAQALAEAARERVKQYDWEVIAQETADIYRQLCGEENGPQSHQTMVQPAPTPA
ncbi:hypothetical protein GCM10025857_24880 [Alicyclobacillus contaminans]|uniref:1,4-alpha-glucan branching protein domain-containing protein n=1 Tax=Alicyclobacillus contaminans TaxID=392016 RepID=UPI0004033B07|nr:1,4-alpha-glucan branching protein domain-containing protein [Alicyclobacillus contaminans]GMA51131.1 hypothetical protein GCM10025857_24880 [Alicyclobacillus contaminans]